MMEEEKEIIGQPEFDNIDINPPQFDGKHHTNGESKEIEHLEDVSTTSDHTINITVGEPQKVGDGMGSYVAYKVTAIINNVPGFKKSHTTTLRRFSDFLGLHEMLVGKYLRNGRIIPPAPEKNIIGTTKVKMTNQQQNEVKSNLSNEWLENRRCALERYLNRTAQHSVLREDPDFINFLESDIELPRAVNTAALSGAGVMRLFNKVGETVNKITYRMDESDQWFNEKVNEIEIIDAHLQKLYSVAKGLYMNRKELALNTGNVSKSAAVLSACEEHTGLSRALSQLADVEEKIELLRSEQANSDHYILTEQIKDYLGLINAIKDVFHERVKVFQNWEYAQMQLTKKRENKAKLELAGRNEKIDWADKEVQEWESKVNRLEKEFKDISTQIKQEVDKFDIQRVRDFKTIMIKYFENQMAHQNQLMKYWQGYLEVASEIA